MELEELSETLAGVMTSISISMLLLQTCMYLGLRYLWNIMNLLQFLIFM